MRRAWLATIIGVLVGCSSASSPSEGTGLDSSASDSAISESSSDDSGSEADATVDSASDSGVPTDSVPGDSAADTSVTAEGGSDTGVIDSGLDPTQPANLSIFCKAGAPRLQWDGGLCHDTLHQLKDNKGNDVMGAPCAFARTKDNVVRCVPLPFGKPAGHYRKPCSTTDQYIDSPLPAWAAGAAGKPHLVWASVDFGDFDPPRYVIAPATPDTLDPTVCPGESGAPRAIIAIFYPYDDPSNWYAVP